VKDYGTDQAYTITPDAQYHVADVLVDGVSVGAVTSYSFSGVAASHTIAATFASNAVTITATAGANGTVGPSGAISQLVGTDLTITVTPNAHYHVADVVVDGVSQGAISSYTFTSVTASHTLAASFAITTRVITASSGPNGTITPVGSSTVNDGAASTYTITANPGYHVLDVTVDGVSKGGVGSYTFSNITADHAIAASFEMVFPHTSVLDPLGNTSLVAAASEAVSPAVPLGSPWVGNITGLVIQNHAMMQTTPSSYAIWNGRVFTGDQEAWYRMTAVDATAPEHDLLLKVQGSSWTTGAIQVVYSAPQGRVVVNTYTPGAGWVRRGGPWNVTFQAGDQFGARAFADGRVRTYRNGALIGETLVTGWPFATSGGRIGLILAGAANSRFINFGGGNFLNTAPTAAIVAPVNGGSYVNGTSLFVSGNGIDAEEPAQNLSYRWTLLDAANQPIGVERTSRVDSLPVPAAGAGTQRRVRLTVTDAGGLSGVAEVTLQPEVDLAPSAMSAIAGDPSAGLPTTGRFTITNFGRMPAPAFHWMVVANGIAVAQGDTAVGARDSVRVQCAMPAAPVIGYGLRIVVDTTGVVAETNETNNVAMQVWGASTFPTTAVLDSLGAVTGPNRPLGAPWTGNVSGLQVVNHALSQSTSSSYAIWNGGVFGADQEAWYQFQAVGSAPEHDLLLKVQGTSWTAGAIQVVYSSSQGLVVVNTYAPGQGWVRRGGPWRVTFAAGDQFGARAFADGRVCVYRNGVVLGDVTVGNWPFATSGGRVGLMLNGATSSRLIRFGGGSAVVHGALAATPVETQTPTGPASAIESRLPVQVSLSLPQPNPTTSQAVLRLSLPRAARVRMDVYDVGGRAVSAGIDRSYEAGTWTLNWSGVGSDARPLPTGLYFIRLDVDGSRFLRRVNLVR
jgi:hypothetical protein